MRKTLIRKSLQNQGLSSLSSWPEHGGAQADMVLDASWFAGNTKSAETLGSIVSIENVKAGTPQRHTFSNKEIPTPTKPYLLIVPLSMRLWGQ